MTDPLREKRTQRLPVVSSFWVLEGVMNSHRNKPAESTAVRHFFSACGAPHRQAPRIGALTAEQQRWQAYEAAKHLWECQNPGAPCDEHEAAMRAISQRVGV